MAIPIIWNGFFMSAQFKHYLLLNLTVFIWGFTGVLGREISLNANEIVFFRMGIAYISLVAIGSFYRKKRKLNTREIVYVMITGLVVGFHWFAFFQSIKLSSVEVAVVCLSSATLFTALLEPLFFKRKVLLSELILSAVIIGGIILIIGFEPEYISGILVGLIAAVLAALFNVLNGKFIQTMPSFQITKYEMLGGFITMTFLLWFSGGLNATTFQIDGLDWFYLIILGIVCTTATFLLSVWLMKFLSPFTVSMSINMEPIYAILIVLIIDFFRGEIADRMSGGFYLGTAVILGAIFINAYLKKKKSRR